VMEHRKGKLFSYPEFSGAVSNSLNSCDKLFKPKLEGLYKTNKKI
jgi:hypothetical protein